MRTGWLGLGSRHVLEEDELQTGHQVYFHQKNKIVMANIFNQVTHVCVCLLLQVTYDKAVCGGGGGQ
jgi:hypothetical protein